MAIGIESALWPERLFLRCFCELPNSGWIELLVGKHTMVVSKPSSVTTQDHKPNPRKNQRKKWFEKHVLSSFFFHVSCLSFVMGWLAFGLLCHLFFNTNLCIFSNPIQVENRKHSIDRSHGAVGVALFGRNVCFWPVELRKRGNIGSYDKCTSADCFRTSP